MTSVFNRRNSLRLQGYDYAQPGAYFVTTVTYHREHLFGEVANEIMQLSELGKIIQSTLMIIPIHYPQINLGPFVIMPNHVHMIISIDDNSSDTSRGGSTNVLSTYRVKNHENIKTIDGDMKTRPSARHQESIPGQVIHSGIPDIVGFSNLFQRGE